jgi:predicted NUDIX family NTP pyrophosphohydrolase
MPRQSAGLLLFRGALGAIEVLLVHPGGPFWAKKDEGAWSIPKGEFSVDEDALQAALREFKEETAGSAATRSQSNGRRNPDGVEHFPRSIEPLGFRSTWRTRKF